eukprot:1188508-Prorocentrum_minimum.AAC.3
MMKLFGRGRKPEGQCDINPENRWNGINFPQLFSSGGDGENKAKPSSGGARGVCPAAESWTRFPLCKLMRHRLLHESDDNFAS